MHKTKLQAIDICAEYYRVLFLKTKNKKIDVAAFYKSGEEQLKSNHAQYWPYFESAAKKLNTIANINYKDFIEFCSANSVVFLHPKFLSSYKAYDNYMPRYLELKERAASNRVYDDLVSSIRKISEVCVDRNYPTFRDFVNEELWRTNGGMPIGFSLIMDGTVSIGVLVFIHDIMDIIKSWAQDVKYELKLNHQNIANTMKIVKDGVYIKARTRTVDVEKIINEYIKEILCQRKS